jgi:hypothetical protein
MSHQTLRLPSTTCRMTAIPPPRRHASRTRRLGFVAGAIALLLGLTLKAALSFAGEGTIAAGIVSLMGLFWIGRKVVGLI